MKPAVVRFLSPSANMLWIIGLAILAVFTVKGSANYIDMLINKVSHRIIADNQTRLLKPFTDIGLGFPTIPPEN